MLHSLRFRLILALALVVVAVVGGIALASSQVTSVTFRNYEDRRGIMRDRRFQGFLAGYYSRHGSWVAVQPEVEQVGQILGGRVILADTEGWVVADSEGELLGQPLSEEWAPPPQTVFHQGVPVGSLYISPPSPPNGEQFLASANRALLLIAIGAGLGAVLLVLGLSRRILAPVDALTVAARRMAAGDLSQRVEITSEDEIGDLARAFNGMADGLARLEALRRNMVTDVAHELRTPLTSIRGYLEALQDGMLAPDRQLVDSLHEEVLHLNRLVDDLQELSLAEAGQLKLERQALDLLDVVEGVIEPLSPRAQQAAVTLHTGLENLPLVDGDPHRVGQILRNLLENGLTHTPPGGEIAVGARAADAWVEVSVRDTGVGISEDDLPHIFERFYRADKSRSRATGGAGLGLAIAKQLVAAHGGRIWAESSEGEGSTFFFTLPVLKE